MRFSKSVLAILFGCAVSLVGQTTGEIAGEIRDPSGSIVVGAEVSVANKSTGAERRTMTNEAGVYNFSLLQPGVYEVRVTAEGFQSMTRSGLELQIQQTARVDFTLQLGQASQVVNVDAGAPLLTTENATIGSVVENRRIVDLPLNGRNFLQLVGLSPNVSAGFGDNASASSRLGGSRSQQNISVSGARSEFNHFTLDGVENTDPNFNTYVFLPSVDALEEFKVQTGVYPAEFGRAVGQVNVSTKSGTNNFHGSAFEFLRNDKLDATDYAFGQNVTKNPFKWNQYGFTVGGPVWIPKVFNGRNRLFFMTTFEGYRDRKALQGFYNVPSVAMRAGNFAGLPQIFDPASRSQQGTTVLATPFPNNIIPVTRLNQKSLQLLEFIPAPNVNTGSFNSDLQEQDRRVINKDQFTQRVDFNESSASNWYGRFSWGSESQTQQALGGTGTKVNTQPRQEMISNSRVFSPTLVNEFRASHTGFANDLSTPLAGVRDVTSELGIPGINPPKDAWGIPNIQINPFSIFGDANLGPYVNNNHIFQFVDNVSWTRGKHSLRFGAEIRRDRFNTSGNSSARGLFNFTGTATENPALPLGNSLGTGTGMADFLTGYAQSSTVSVGLGFAQFRSTNQNYYIDDTWRVLPKLTISVGLRYEFTPPYNDQSGKFVNISVPLQAYPGLVNPADRSLHPTLVRVGTGDFYQDVGIRFNSAVNVARDGRLGDSTIHSDRNDFAPRLGIAWSPSDKWTIRAGAGVFFVQDISNFYLDAARNITGTRVATANTTIPNVNIDNPFGQTVGSLVTISTPKVLGIDPYRRTPYNIQFSFNVQRQLTQSTVLEVGYLGSESHKLQSWDPFNEPYPSAVGTPQSRAPFPEFSAQGWIMTGIGNANYNSLSGKLQHRFSHGLSLMASYTWSKSIDLSSGARNHTGEQQFPVSGYCLQCERGLSNFNVAHRFVTSTIYELPFGKGKAFLHGGGISNAIAGGWQITSIITLQTGTPATVIAGYDASNRGYNNPSDRPNSTGVNAALPDGQATPDHFFNTAAFTKPIAGTIGNTGRNTLIGPGLFDWDFSAFKSFQFTENQRLQLRFESFNFTNHPSFGLPDTNLTDAGFGTIRTTNTNMRNIQIGVKYTF